MQFRSIIVSCALSMSLIAMAQAGADATKAPAAPTTVTPAEAMDSALSLIEGEMMGAVKAMPADKYSFAPSASIFVPSQNTEFKTVRTFGQQVAHVAQANYFFFMTLSGMKPDVDVRAIGSLTGKDEAVAALSGSFAFGHKAIATLTAANAFEVLKTPEPGVQTRLTFAGFAISHANDHYGQMIEYLRMNGLVPPASAR